MLFKTFKHGLVIAITLLFFVFGFYFIGLYSDINHSLFPIGNQFHEEFPCISFNPYRTYDHPPKLNDTIEIEILRQDLLKIKEFTSCVRTYSSTGAAGLIPKVARELDMTVVLGAFLSSDKKRNKKELSSLVELANQYPNVTHMVVASEVLLHLKNYDGYMELSYEKLVEALRWVRARTTKPISYGDVVGIWLQRLDLLNEVDFVTAHFLPYWKDIPTTEAMNWMRGEYEALLHLTTKPIFIGEVGWPTRGPIYGGGQPSPENQAAFLKLVASTLRTEKWPQMMKPSFNVIEAFDQPWKSYSREGRVARHWGIFNASGEVKALTKSEKPKPNYFAFTILGLAFLSFFILYIFGVVVGKFTTLTQLSWWSFSLIATLLVSAVTMIGARLDYMIGVTSVFALLGLFCINAMVAIEAFLNCRIFQDKEGRGFSTDQACADPKLLQKFVSIQMPCANEPAEQVIESIKAICKLNYQNFELLVLINNTYDPSLWEPVESFCKGMPAHIRFINLGRVQGFKSGVLNRALSLMNQDAEFVAIVDADYVVSSDWLQRVMPFFEDLDVASVQCPQDYRDADESLFKTLMGDELQGFFDIGMVERAKSNAIVQHGTMLAIRRTVLEELGNWSEATICEDAELGLRILASGRKMIYRRVEAGKGLLPNSHFAYARQRYRWVYGGLRIILGQWRLFRPRSKQLNHAQKFFYFWGWFPWLADATFIPFFILSFFLGLGIALDPKFIPSPIYTLPLMLFVVHRILSVLMNYRARVSIPRWRQWLCLLGGLSLVTIVSAASISALCGFKAGFTSTAKGSSKKILPTLRWRAWLWLLYGWGIDAFMGSAMLMLSFFVLIGSNYSFDGICWSLYLLIFSLPGLAYMFVRVAESYAKLSTISLANKLAITDEAGQ